MKIPRSSVTARILLATVLFGAPALLHADKPTEPIYNESADAAVEITSALATARQGNKRVLLQFGANWCPWCHKLHQLFLYDETIATELKRSYIVVMVDVNKGHNKAVDENYGSPTKQGLPVLVILDVDGTLLTTQETGALEDGSAHDPQKVLGFLKQWAAPR